MALAKPLTKDVQRAALSTRVDTPAGKTSSQSATLGDAVESWFVSLRAGDASPKTLAAYGWGVGRFVAHVGPAQPLAAITVEDVESFIGSLKTSGLSEASRNAAYRPVRTFLRWCVKRGLLTSNPSADVAAPKVTVQPVQFVTDAEFAAILATTDTRSRWAFRARRDRAILLMLATTGARLSEVTDLQVSDVDLTAGTFLVHGKGGKDRVLPLLDGAKAALDTYLRLERPRSAYSTSTALWLAPRGPLTPNGVAQMVADRGKAAGLKRRAHPHELRHRAIATWLRKGMPGPLVQALSGHSTPAMLARYGAHTRSEDAMDFLRGLAG